MDINSIKEMMEIHKTGFLLRQRRYKIIAGLSYVVCGMFLAGLIYVLSTPYYGSTTPMISLACTIGCISSYTYGLNATKDALTEAQGMAMFDTIKPEDLENYDD